MTMSFPSSAKEVKKSSEHKVKGFADDITIINTNPEDHQQILTYINSHCFDTGLTIRPDKCYSVVFNGKKVVEHLPFAVGPGQTRDIRKYSTTFLGSTVSHSFHQSMIQASEAFSTRFRIVLGHLDQMALRGEYKLWIYRRDFIPSLYFQMIVNNISATVYKNIVQNALCFFPIPTKSPS